VWQVLGSSVLALPRREGSADLVANATGVAVIDRDGQILDAGWTRGIEQAIGWADRAAGDGDALLFAAAPLVVANEMGQRLCEMRVRQRYGRWKVSANTTNIHLRRLARVKFLRLAILSGRLGPHRSEHHGFDFARSSACPPNPQAIRQSR
jgi:hypothetical protein